MKIRIGIITELRAVENHVMVDVWSRIINRRSYKESKSSSREALAMMLRSFGRRHVDLFMHSLTAQGAPTIDLPSLPMPKCS